MFSCKIELAWKEQVAEVADKRKRSGEVQVLQNSSWLLSTTAGLQIPEKD